MPVFRDEELTDKALAEAIEGDLVLTLGEEGPRIPLELSSSQRSDFERAKLDGFIDVGRRWGEAALCNVWYWWCKLRRAPHVVLQRRCLYAAVKVDLTALAATLERSAIAQANASLRDLQCGGVERGEIEPVLQPWRFDSLMLWDGIPNDNAHWYARALLDIVKTALGWSWCADNV